MVVIKNAMQVYSLLNKSNCRLCGEKTCLAFAGAVYTGSKRLEECPELSVDDIARLLQPGMDDKTNSAERKADEIMEEFLDSMKQQVKVLDFLLAAKRVGGTVRDEVLSVPVLGKNFGIKKEGSFVTDLHTTPWLVVPFLDYLLHCKGTGVSGNWISFREIKGGKEKYALFKKRGEDVLKQLADIYPDFFNDIVHMFDGKKVEEQFESDISVVLYPLPLVPIMLCYWKAEEGLGSTLNVYFDKSVDDNLGVDSTFSLATGLAQMVQKLSEHHGF